MWKKYITASSIDEALAALAEGGETARIVAGATDLILEIERGVRRGIETLIDVTRIPGLDEIRLDDEGRIHLGPLVTHNDCAASPLIRKHALALAQASWLVGAPQIRNRSTIAGNLITASPANDAIPPLMALDASLLLRSAEGERTVALRDFYTGLRQTVLRPDEMLVDIHFAAPDPERSKSAFIKMALRRAQAISVVSGAAALSFEGDKIESAAVTLGAVQPTIVHAEAAEDFLVGKSLDQDTIERAGELAQEAAAPIDDVRSSAAYRLEMVKVGVRRMLRDLAAEEQPLHMPADPVLLAPGKALPAAPAGGHQPGQAIDTTINGQRVRIDSGQEKTLLRWLREDAGLIGTKEGCAEGECGACTVFLDGEAVMSCLVPAPRAHGAEIITVEGLSVDGLHPVQKTFIEQGAVQCGYCTPGFIMSAAKLLEERPHPTRAEAQEAVTGNLCRCTGYYKILDAIEDAGRTDEPA